MGSFLTKLIFFDQIEDIVSWPPFSNDHFGIWKHLLNPIWVTEALNRPQKDPNVVQMVSFLNHIVCILYKRGLQVEPAIPCYIFCLVQLVKTLSWWTLAVSICWFLTVCWYTVMIHSVKLLWVQKVCLIWHHACKISCILIAAEWNSHSRIQNSQTKLWPYSVTYVKKSVILIVITPFCLFPPKRKGFGELLSKNRSEKPSNRSKDDGVWWLRKQFGYFSNSN